MVYKNFKHKSIMLRRDFPTAEETRNKHVFRMMESINNWLVQRTTRQILWNEITKVDDYKEDVSVLVQYLGYRVTHYGFDWIQPNCAMRTTSKVEAYERQIPSYFRTATGLT